jgi:hypothetical protein
MEHDELVHSLLKGYAHDAPITGRAQGMGEMARQRRCVSLAGIDSPARVNKVYRLSLGAFACLRRCVPQPFKEKEGSNSCPHTIAIF